MLSPGGAANRPVPIKLLSRVRWGRAPRDPRPPRPAAAPPAVAVARYSCDVLPSGFGQEAVVAAREQLGPVRETDAVDGLDGRPVVEDLRHGVTPGAAAFDGAVDAVAGTDVGQAPDAAVGHKDRRLAVRTVRARVRTAAVRVDRPLKGHARRPRHAVQRALRPHLVEARVKSLRSVERPHDTLADPTGKPAALVLLDELSRPAHERMFAQTAAERRGRRRSRREEPPAR